VFVNLVLPIISQWDSCEELHFIQDGTPPHFAFPVCAWLHSRLPVRCPCWSRTNRMASKRFRFVKFSQRGILPTKTKHACWIARINFRYFCRGSSWPLR